MASSSTDKSLGSLLEVLRTLRGENGCPWDRKQTFESLRSGFLEEVYELVDGIDRRDSALIREELGDVFFNLLFFSELAREEGWFDAVEALDAVREKLIFRHPHVFDPNGKKAETAEEVLGLWEANKQKENDLRKKKRDSILDGVPDALPSLIRARQLQEKTAHVGFDWSDAMGVLEKVEEEIGELKTAIRDKKGVEDELGDVLFTLVNLSRRLGVDPDRSLSAANRKFKNRFAHMEKNLRDKGQPVADQGSAGWEALWQTAKKDFP